MEAVIESEININKNIISNEEKTYFSNKLKEAEKYDAKHLDVYTLDEIVTKHKQKYRI